MRIVRFAAIVLVTSLLAVPAVLAESKIQGKVIDTAGKPVAGASIVLDSEEEGVPTIHTKSKKKGTYFFGMVKRGKYRLTIEAEGMRVAEVEINAINSSKDVVFDLAGQIRPGAEMPVFEVGPSDVVTYNLTLCASTTGSGEHGTGVSILGSDEIVQLIEKGKIDKARSEISRGLETDPEDPRLYYVSAYLEMKEGNTGPALAAIDRALEVDASFPGANLLKGALLEQAGDFPGAHDAYKKEIEISSDTALLTSSFVRLSQLDRRMGNLEEAQEALTRLIELDPSTRVIAYSQLLEIYLEKDDPDAAAALLAEAPPELMNDAVAHFNLGADYWNLGKSSEAAAEFRKTIELDPGMADAYRLLGFAEAGAGNSDRAVEALNKYLELAPDAGDADAIRQYIEKTENAQN